ncbi:MAG: CHAP domain-containing protein [Candidatus Sacchiramonaceae bacterium]|nr:CHAP domain-containing protein [Candidatus Saccharimonadaceae bacterium]
MTKIQKNKITNNSQRIISSLLIASLLIGSVSMLAKDQSVFARDYDAEIREVKKRETEAQSQANALGERGKTLQAELDRFSREKTVIESQIRISQIEHDKLVAEIEQTEKKIVDTRKALGAILTEMSLEDEVSPIERLAGSENISVALDKFEYKNAVKSSLTDKVGEIREMKKNLEDKQADVARVLNNQKTQQKQLATKESEQAKLVAETKGEEAEYRKYADALSAERSKLESEQAAAIARRAANSGGYVTGATDGSNGGYPSIWANAPMNSYVDSWGMYSRQCVSYAAFKVSQAYGNMPYWGGIGNANEWLRNARNQGIPNGSTPKVGSVGVQLSGTYGHVAWIEAVNPNGTLRISHYNVNWTGTYAVWDNVSPSFFDGYIYFGEW